MWVFGELEELAMVIDQAHEDVGKLVNEPVVQGSLILYVAPVIKPLRIRYGSIPEVAET